MFQLIDDSTYVLQRQYTSSSSISTYLSCLDSLGICLLISSQFRGMFVYAWAHWSHLFSFFDAKKVQFD